MVKSLSSFCLMALAVALPEETPACPSQSVQGTALIQAASVQMDKATLGDTESVGRELSMAEMQRELRKLRFQVAVLKGRQPAGPPPKKPPPTGDAKEEDFITRIRMNFDVGTTECKACKGEFKDDFMADLSEPDNTQETFDIVIGELCRMCSDCNDDSCKDAGVKDKWS